MGKGGGGASETQRESDRKYRRRNMTADSAMHAETGETEGEIRRNETKLANIQEK